MKLKDIADMEDYLENRCYCPHEIYDMTGFFYELFYPKTECIYIEITDNMVDDCVRIDNTQNNREQIEKYMNSEISKMSFDEYEVGSTHKNIDKIMSVANAICVS